VKHLTYTGFDAGRPLCGAPRDLAGVYEHAVYARMDTRERINSFCSGCLATWLSYAYDGEDLPDWPISADDVRRIEESIPREFASDDEVRRFRRKLDAWNASRSGGAKGLAIQS